MTLNPSLCCERSCDICRYLLSTCYIYSLNPHNTRQRRSIIAIPFNRARHRGSGRFSNSLRLHTETSPILSSSAFCAALGLSLGQMLLPSGRQAWVRQLVGGGGRKRPLDPCLQSLSFRKGSFPGKRSCALDSPEVMRVLRHDF